MERLFFTLPLFLRRRRRNRIGLGYVRNPEGVTDDWLRSGRYELVVAGETVAATLTLEPLYDPQAARVKA